MTLRTNFIDNIPNSLIDFLVRLLRNWKFYCTLFCISKEMSFVFQMDEDSQISKYTQTEEDQYEMQVRAANIVCINIFVKTVVSALYGIKCF